VSRLSGLSVLLVEDEFLIAIETEEILRSLGIDRIQTAATLEDARQRAEGGGFDLVVLDVNLNGQLSFPFARALRERGIPVVFASGYGVPHQQQSGFDESAFVTKPYTAEHLEAAIAAALDGAKRAR
jgi:DNA-binding response OmpR family regulator